MNKEEALPLIAVGVLTEVHRCTDVFKRCEVCEEEDRCPDCIEYFADTGIVWYTDMCKRHRMQSEADFFALHGIGRFTA